MTDPTRRNILRAFLAGVLVLSVAVVWIFAAQRRDQVTALGQKIFVPKLAFAVAMPKGWQQMSVQRWMLPNSLVYGQPSDKGAYDSSMRQDQQRRIFFIAIKPNASDEQVLTPLKNLAFLWGLNHNYLGGFVIGPLGALRFDEYGYEHLQAVINFRGARSRATLIRHEQIKANGRVFWCVMAGNTQLNEADKALLTAVASSFELLDQS